MKRLLILILLCLAACNNNTGDQATSAPSNTVAPPTATELRETATPLVVSTLPPTVQLQVQGANIAPTRTLAPSITPAQRATSNLMIPVTPDATATATTAAEATAEVNDFETEAQGPVLQLTYGDFTAYLRSYPSPVTADLLVENSATVLYSDTGPQLIFSVTKPNASAPTAITAEVFFRFNRDEGKVTVELGAIYETNNPATAYNGDIVPVLEAQLQLALDELIVVSYGQISEGQEGFAIIGFSAEPEGMTVSTTGN